MNLRTDIPLAPLTTFGVGGPAGCFCAVHTAAEALDAVHTAKDRGLTVFLLGGGSNLLVSDAGVQGLVLKTALEPEVTDHGSGLVSAGAGLAWDALAAWSARRGLTGIEYLSGIPGAVGAAPVQNIGAYGQEIGNTVERVDAIDLDTAQAVSFDRTACRFDYRSSIFNTTHAGRYLITRVWLRLASGPSAAENRDETLRIRRGKGMLEGMHRSAGSFFKNPIIAGHKLSAARLIEDAGIRKGMIMGSAGLPTGQAGVSPHHTLSLVAHRGCTAAHLVALARHVQERVYDRSGIILEPEVRLWGFDEYPLMR